MAWQARNPYKSYYMLQTWFDFRRTVDTFAIQPKLVRQLYVATTDPDTSKIINSIGNLAVVNNDKDWLLRWCRTAILRKVLSMRSECDRLKWSGSLVSGHILLSVCVCLCVSERVYRCRPCRFHLQPLNNNSVEFICRNEIMSKSKIIWSGSTIVK